MISFRAVKLYLYVLLFLITLLIFFPVALHDFVNWDDYVFVVDNTEIGSLSWQSLIWMMTSFYQGMWLPLTWFSHAVDRALWGLNPSYHHLMNALIHALNALLVFALFVRLTEGRELSEEGRYVAAFAGALLFALHPLRVESVAWVSERKGLLSSFFFLSSLIFYLKYARADSTIRRGCPKTTPAIGHRPDGRGRPASLPQSNGCTEGKGGHIGPPLRQNADVISGQARRGGSRTAPTDDGPSRVREFTSPSDGMGKGDGDAYDEHPASAVTSAKAGVQERLQGLYSAPRHRGDRRNDEVGVARHSRTYYALALLLCLLAVLSKSVAVMLPFVYLVLDYYPLERLKAASWRRLFLEKVPFFIVSVVTTGLNMLAFETEGELSPHVPLHIRIMSALYGIVFYLKQTVFPENLLPLYRMDGRTDYFGAPFLLSAVLVVGLTAGSVWRAFGGERLWVSVWSYYLISLAPTMSLFMYNRYGIQDRYTYLAALGFYLLAGLGAGRMWDKAYSLPYRLGASAVLIGCVCLPAVFFGYKTAHQIAKWQNAETLWTHVLAQSKHPPHPALFGLGMEFEKKGELDRALALYEKALSLNPKAPRYVAQVANVIAAKGDPEKALGMYTELTKAHPRDAYFHFHRGRMLALMGRDDEAFAAFEHALKIAPRATRAWFLRVLVQAAAKDRALAAQYYRRYLSEGYARDPDFERHLGIESGRAGQPR